MSNSQTNELAGDQKAEIIDSIYEVAVDPARYEALLETWERRIAPLRGDDWQRFNDQELEQHAARAWLFLDRYDAASSRSGVHAALAEIGRTAAFACSDPKIVMSANPAAGELFGLEKGSRLSSLPIEPEDVEAVGKAIRGVLSATGKADKVVRTRSVQTGGPIVFRIRKAMDGETPAALVVTSEFAWPAELTDTMREAFDLTLAEVEVVRAVTSGLSTKDIARSRNRSLDTVRSQLKSVLAKTETHSQSELVRVTLGLMDVIGGTVFPPAGTGINATIRTIAPSTITLKDGRRFDYIEFGDSAGRPCLFFPIDYGLIRWPASAEAAAERRNIRVISPIRGGFGHTSPLPQGCDYARQTGLDALELMDQLKIGRSAIIALGADLRFAVHAANIAPDRISGILGCAAMLPVQTAEQYDRMGKWHRFILANGRYAPRLLPFLVKGGFSMARRMGKDRFFAAVNASSPADLRTFEIPEVRQAILAGSDVCLSDWHSAHDAFAREVIDSEVDLSEVIRACTVPIKLLQGDQDPQSPAETVREIAPLFPNLDVEMVDGAGQLLFFQEWPHAPEGA